MSSAKTQLTELDAEVSQLSYEEARSQLVEVVARLEQGDMPLADALATWERGEALARRCETWLAGARERLAAARAATETTATENTPAQ
ncbi:MAG: exodeoxyribonuclease VII small subunit [Trueperella sp.]|nr:exodeoxyribonuclease VII small subunit [Trueperella sp.]